MLDAFRIGRSCRHAHVWHEDPEQVMQAARQADAEAHCIPLRDFTLQIKEEESHLTQQALREGCSPKDMHRLLLGGCCRNWTPAAKGAGEEGAGGMAEAQDIADETMSIAPSRAGAIAARPLWLRLKTLRMKQ
eukprot:1150573-Pelagomonas_calceolata.AAC.9